MGYINYCRQLNYKKKMRNRRNHPNKNHTGPDVIVGTPMDIARANVIHNVTNDLANTWGTISNKSIEDIVEDIRLIVFNISTTLIIFLIAFSILYTLNVIQIFQVSPAVHLILSGLAGVSPGLAIRLKLVKNDVKITDKLLAEFNEGSEKRIDFAMERLDHIQERIQRTSVLLVAHIISGSPGKAIKYSSYEPDEIGEVLVEAIPEVNEESAVNILEGVNWLSRDYPTAVEPYAGQFKQLLKVTSTPIQCHSVEILGNIGRMSSNKKAYVNAIKPAVSDDDSDVRSSAVSALSKLPCEESLKLLENLSTDTDPTVRDQASDIMQQMAT